MEPLTAEALARLPFFQDFQDRELELLANLMTACHYGPGEVVCRKGDRAASCFVVLEGEIHVVVDAADGQREVLAKLAAGELFGEVALIDGGLRSATCAAGPLGARLAALGRAEFDRIFNAGSPFAYKLMDLIGERVVERLRDASARLVDLVVAERNRRAT